MLICAIISRVNSIVIQLMETYIFLSKDSHRVRIYYFHHQGEILTEKILRSNHFVEPVFDEKKGCYHISWESFVYLVEGIVLKDRKVAFNDLNDENDEELGMDIEEPAQGKIDEKELLKEAI